MKTSDAYHVYFLAAESGYDGKDVSAQVAELDEEQKEMFYEAEYWYRSIKRSGRPCPMMEIPYGSYDDCSRESFGDFGEMKPAYYSGGFVIFRNEKIREYRLVPVKPTYGDKILRYKTLCSFFNHCPYTTDKIPMDKLRLAEALLDKLPVDDELYGVLGDENIFF